VFDFINRVDRNLVIIEMDKVKNVVSRKKSRTEVSFRNELEGV